MLAACLIFGLPMILAAVLISPTGLHDVVHGLPLAAIAIGILLPFAAWPLFLSTFALPPPGSGRIEALIKLWAGATVMATAVINLLSAVFDYAPKRPDQPRQRVSCWLDLSSACSSRPDFGELWHPSCRASLQFAER